MRDELVIVGVVAVDRWDEKPKDQMVLVAVSIDGSGSR
jgi:hypothetical protein